MAHRGNLPRNPHLQVGSRVKALSSLLVAALAFSVITVAAPAADAASKSPTPKPKVTAKATVKATAKATTKPKATAKETAKPKATAKETATKKATAKASAKPKPKKKVVKKKRAKVRITPSPKPVWPPEGFSVEGEVYAKVPTAKELVGLISANTTLQKQIKECSTYICASVQVASEIGCIWWEVVSVVSDAQGNKLGDLTTALSSSEPKEFKTLIVVSPEFVDKGGSAKIISVICHHEDRITSDPKINYKKVS